MKEFLEEGRQGRLLTKLINATVGEGESEAEFRRGVGGEGVSHGIRVGRLVRKK